jgi:hypothetical protein
MKLAEHMCCSPTKLTYWALASESSGSHFMPDTYHTSLLQEAAPDLHPANR